MFKIDLRAKGSSGFQEQLPSLLEVSGDHAEQGLIHLESVFALPIPTFLTQLLCFLYVLLDIMPVAKGYV